MNLPILKIIDKYDLLKKGFKFILLNNPSNNAPYHNLNHLLTVTKQTYYALDYMTMLDDDKVEPLLLAALFHDYNHSMGEKKDNFNIEDAKLGLKTFVDIEKIDFDLEFMYSILDATQYPYVIEGKDLNIYQSIIRDADLFQVFEYDWVKQCIVGLSSEMNTSINDLIVGQRKFLESIKFLTSYGKHIGVYGYNKCLVELEILERVMS
jgi:hypothetical protein